MKEQKLKEKLDGYSLSDQQDRLLRFCEIMKIKVVHHGGVNNSLPFVTFISIVL